MVSLQGSESSTEIKTKCSRINLLLILVFIVTEIRNICCSLLEYKSLKISLSLWMNFLWQPPTARLLEGFISFYSDRLMSLGFFFFPLVSEQYSFNKQPTNEIRGKPACAGYGGGYRLTAVTAWLYTSSMGGMEIDLLVREGAACSCSGIRQRWSLKMIWVLLFT